MTRSAAAARVFRQVLEDLGVDADTVEADPTDLGRRGALLAAADLVWSRHLGPGYSTKQVRELLGCSRQAVSERVQRGTLLALPTREGQPTFPAFQFGAGGGLLPGLGELVRALR